MKHLKYFESFDDDPLLRNSEYIINDDYLVVIKVNSWEDMVTLGVGTMWPMSDPNRGEKYYKLYTKDGTHFIIILDYKEKGPNSKIVTVVKDEKVYQPGFYNRVENPVSNNEINDILSKYGHSISDITV